MEKKNDLLIIAGKGHEMYQEIEKEQLPFDERKIVKDIIQGLADKNKKQ